MITRPAAAVLAAARTAALAALTMTCQAARTAATARMPWRRGLGAALAAAITAPLLVYGAVPAVARLATAGSHSPATTGPPPSALPRLADAAGLGGLGHVKAAQAGAQATAAARAARRAWAAQLAAAQARAQAAAAHATPAASAPPPPAIAAPAATGVYSYTALEALWVAAGGPASSEAGAAAIAECESGGNPKAYNPSGASGLWQILGQPFPGDPFDPATNARMAVAKYTAAGDSFSPWVCQP